MTEQENINNALQMQISVHDERFNAVMTRLDATNEKLTVSLQK